MVCCENTFSKENQRINQKDNLFTYIGISMDVKMDEAFPKGQNRQI